MAKSNKTEKTEELIAGYIRKQIVFSPSYKDSNLRQKALAKIRKMFDMSARHITLLTCSNI